MRSEALTGHTASMQIAEQINSATAETTPTIDPSVWVDEHGDYLFRYAVLRLRDESLAEDAVQEALLAALQAIASYTGSATERTWLTGILKHKIIDHYRKNKNLSQITEDDTDLSGLDHFFERTDKWDGHWVIKLRPVDPEQSPDQVMERDEFWGVMKNCLSALPTRVANVFAMREVDGISSEEICEMLGLSSSNFWVIMHRARMQLRRCIEIKWFRKAI